MKIYEIITMSGGDNLVKSLKILKNISKDLKSPIFKQILNDCVEYIVFHNGARLVYHSKHSKQQFER